MMKSPTRFFFTFAVLFALLGFLFNFLQTQLLTQTTYSYVQELELARFYLRTGQTDRAIEAYNSIINSGTPDAIKSMSYAELTDLLSKSGTPFELLRLRCTYLLWQMVPNVYLISAFFFLILFILIITKPFTKTELIILPIFDFSGLNIGEALPQLVTDRLKELKWKFQNLSLTTPILSEALDVPIFGAVGDHNVVNVSAVVETAVILSGGPSDLPISRIFEFLRLWFEQPRYTVRGNLRISEDILYLSLMLINGKKQNVEQSWQVKIGSLHNSDIINKTVDSLLYPLIFYFSDNSSAKKWNSLMSLCRALEKLHMYQNGDHDSTTLVKARSMLEEALEIDTGYNLAKYNLGVLLLRFGEYENARSKFREVAQDSSDERLRHLASYSYGVSLFEMSQEWSYEFASNIFTNLLDTPGIDNDIEIMSRSALALTYARLAGRKEKRKKELLDLAFREIKTIKAIKSLSPQALSNVFATEGYINITLKQYEESILKFKESVKLDPNNVSHWLGLGDAYTNNKDSQNSLLAFRKAISLSHSSMYANYRMGNIYRDIGDIDNAIEFYKKATPFPLAHLSLGKIYLNRQEYDEALIEFQKSVEKNGHLADAWGNIAWTICEMNTTDSSKLKEAESSARRSIQTEQNQHQLWHRYAILSRALLLSEKYNKAIAAAKKSVELNPKNAQANYYLASAEAAIGNHQKAMEIAQKIANSDQSEWREKSQTLITQLSL